ncbi:MAG: ABC transporter ATP-binding protein [Burkholderiaceae bacterium]|nr:ABC transporter ATP-binding protein [Burkholderiaceae bacterium]
MTRALPEAGTDGTATASAAIVPPLQASGLVVLRGARRALDGVSLSLRAGEWAAVVGPNGAGKSTLLSVLAGLRRPDAGSVRLHGTSLHDWNPRRRAQELAWLSQQGEAEGEISVRDAVRIGRLPRHGLFGAITAQDEAAVEAAMAETECSEYADRRLSELSGGERQRALLARSLTMQAAVLLLDEPAAHLDAPHQRALVRSLNARARAGAAVAVVMHDLTLALAADRLLVMSGGRLQADGPAADTGVRSTLVEVFGGAFSIERIGSESAPRWVVLPAL